MSSPAELFRRLLLQTSKPEMIPRYNHELMVIQDATLAIVQPLHAPGEIEALPQILKMPENVVDQLSPGDPTTDAAMMMGAVAHRGYVYSLSGHLPEISFSQVWKDASPKLAALAERCEAEIDALQPQLNGKYVSIDRAKYNQDFFDQVEKGPESIVVTGINGAGKTVMSQEIMKLLAECGLQGEVIKFPRPDGPLASLILPLLQGNPDGKTLNPAAMQLLFLSDVLDFAGQAHAEGKVCIFDRHPMIEALVYGPQDDFAQTAFSIRQLLPGVTWSFIIGRHPYAAQEAVAARSGKKRIFERDAEMMTEQMIRYAALSSLPGTYWLNNYDLGVTKKRTLGAVLSTGMIPRRLVAEGKAANFDDADTIVFEACLRIMFGDAAPPIELLD